MLGGFARWLLAPGTTFGRLLLVALVDLAVLIGIFAIMAKIAMEAGFICGC